MDSRSSPKSDSSVEPMDISAKSSATDISYASNMQPAKDHIESEENLESDDRADNEEIDADEDEEEAAQPLDNIIHTRKLRNVVRRENLRQLDNSIMVMRKKSRYTNNYRMNAANKNNGNNTQYDNGETGPANDNTKTQYCCPICGVNSPTQHEFTEHIRGHNNADGNQNFTCRICFKVIFVQHLYCTYILYA